MTATIDLEEESITISLEEYKELLEYKGRYLELRDCYNAEKYNIPAWSPGKITWTSTDLETDTTHKTDYPYHYTCGCHHDN